MRKLTALLTALALTLGLAIPVSAEHNQKSEDTVILYTNDVHSHIDKELSYDILAGLKKELESQYEHVLLVDAGDHVQGTAYGAMDKGRSIIELMTAAGYDAAALGNHEFDYGMDGLMNIVEWAGYPYLACNFYHESDGAKGENVLDSYTLFDCGGQQLAFVGITAPTYTTPAHYQDGDGNMIYGISGTSDAASLHTDVQQAIDEATAAGADIVIALGHLGVDPTFRDVTSEKTIAAVSGLDAFIDGHSHTVMAGKLVPDKNGENVLLTQTGEYFSNIGKMVIDAETGEITTELLSVEALADVTSDPDVQAFKDDWTNEISATLGEVIGRLDVTLDNYDADGNRLVRSRETNTGDFCSDALYYLFDNMGLDVDVAVTNGGGVRSQTLTGDITYLDCKTIHPFGNIACMQTVTGQQLLDMLEWSACEAGFGMEVGGFLHVSGIKLDIDITIPSTVQSVDGAGEVWAGPPTGEYRVSNVQIYDKDTCSWTQLDPDAHYNLASYNYILRNQGNGYTMLSDSVNVVDHVMEDYMVLANYISAFENSVVEARNSPISDAHPGFDIDYSSVYGDGRITIHLPHEADSENPFTDLDASAWYHDAVEYVLDKGLMSGVSADTFAPGTQMSRGMMVTILWNLAGKPVVESSIDFSDVEDGQWYSDAVRWAVCEGIASGYGNGTFGISDLLTREQLAAMLYSHEKRQGGGFVGAWMFRLDYADVMQISDWAYEPMCWMIMKGVISGKDGGILDPCGIAVRAEAAQMLMQFLELKR